MSFVPQNPWEGLIYPTCLKYKVTRRFFSRASVKRTYDVYYALILPPDVQIELQRRTADFRNFFCPSEIDTRDVQKLSKGPPTFNQLYDVCPAYLPEIRYLC